MCAGAFQITSILMVVSFLLVGIALAVVRCQRPLSKHAGAGRSDRLQLSRRATLCSNTLLQHFAPTLYVPTFCSNTFAPTLCVRADDLPQERSARLHRLLRRAARSAPLTSPKTHTHTQTGLLKRSCQSTFPPPVDHAFVRGRAVASIPIATPVVANATMALGARALAKEGALVTRLAAIEEVTTDNKKTRDPL